MLTVTHNGPRNIQASAFSLNSVVAPEDLQSVNNHQQWTSSLLWSMVVVTLSTSFVMGVHTGGPNLYNGFIVPWLRGYPFPCQKDGSTARWIARVWWDCDYVNISAHNTTGYYYLPAVPTENQFAQSFIDSLHSIIFVVGAVVGSFTSQYWYEFLTRRNTIFANMLFQVVASVLMIVPLEIYHGYDRGDPSLYVVSNVLQNKFLAVALFYASRFLSGWSAGMCCVVTTIYLIEISPRTMRGKVVTYHQLFIVIGILVGQIVSFPWILGQHNKWHWGMAWVGIFPLAGCFLIWTLPESPRYFVQERMRHEALESLRALRKMNEVQTELDEIERQEATVNVEDLSLIRLFTSPRFRWPLLTSVLLSAAAQFSGINSVFFYSDGIFSTMGLVDDKVYWSVVATGLSNLVATIASIRLIESFGRRPLILYPLATIVLIMILLCVFIQVNAVGLAGGTLFLVLLFIALFAAGLGPIPFLYPNEVFTISVRPMGQSIAMLSLFFCDLVVILLFPFIEAAIGSYVFLFFCVCCLLSFVFLWRKMPETKGQETIGDRSVLGIIENKTAFNVNSTYFI